jgi:AbrB family looped-hinge helix DNA binding protein
MKATIDRAGRLVIPKPLRDRAGLKPGMEVELRYSQGTIEISPPPAKGRVVREGSFLVWESPAGTPEITQEAINQAIEDDREERMREIEGRSGF